MTWTRVRSALFGVALRAYPRAFRERFGGEMRRAFVEHGAASDLVRIAIYGFAERRAAVARWAFAAPHQPHLYAPAEAGLVDEAHQEIRQAIRSIRRAPLFTIFAASALALGIGAATTIFTAAYGVLVRPLPYGDPARLIAVWSNDTNGGSAHSPMSPADFLDMQTAAKPLLSLEAYFSFVTNSRLLADAQAENIRTLSVSPGLFRLLNRGASLGRALQPDDRDVVVLSDGFWRRRFGGERAVLGRRLVVDGTAFTVAGVMPPDFVFPYKGLLGPDGFVDSIDVDLWMPMAVGGPNLVDASGQLSRSTHMLGAIGRLGPDASPAAARDALAGIAAAIERDHPGSNAGWKVSVMAVSDAVAGEVRPALLLLAGGVLVLLLMACLNVASLAFARAAARRGELALRAALGATRSRLVFQAFVEGGVLSAMGATAGLVMSSWGVRALVALAPPDLPRLHEINSNPILVAVTCVLAIVGGLAVGWAPALVAARTDGCGALRESARGSIAPRSRRQLQSAILVAEMALAVLLTIGAGLLMRSFDRLLNLDPGFRVDHVLTAQLTLPERLTTPDARRAFYATLFERLQAMPGVMSAGGTTRIPLGSTSVSTYLQVEGQPRADSELPLVEFRRSLYDYFDTMGIPIVRGRGFLETDGPDAPPVAVVNETLAHRLFPNDNPVGHRVRSGPRSQSAWLTIVGVIGDVRHARLETEPAAELYINALQNPPVSPFIAIRTAGDPADLAERLRWEARALDPAMTLFDVRTMDGIHSASLAGRRFVLLLITAFDVAAILLAIVGVYGVTSLVAVERTQEAGIRLALGATPASVMSLIVRDAAGLAAAGAAIGLGLAAALAPLLGSQLYGVGAFDPVSFLAAPCVLIGAAAVASAVPGWRAMRVDPVRALNSQ